MSWCVAERVRLEVTGNSGEKKDNLFFLRRITPRNGHLPRDPGTFFYFLHNALWVFFAHLTAGVTSRWRQFSEDDLTL